MDGNPGNVDFGERSLAEIAALQAGGKLVAGDIARVEAGDGRTYIVMYGTQGEWISAGDF